MRNARRTPKSLKDIREEVNRDMMIRRSQKALKRSPRTANEIFMRVIGMKELNRAVAFGWTFLEGTSTGPNYARASNHAIVKISRVDLENRLAAMV